MSRFKVFCGGIVFKINGLVIKELLLEKNIPTRDYKNNS